MSDAAEARPSTAPERPGRRARKQERRAARRRATLQARLKAADKLVAKRTAQLGRASERRAAIEARLTKLDAGRPAAYCLRDRARVAIVDPKPVVTTGGRHALAGTCPNCGSRVVGFGAA